MIDFKITNSESLDKYIDLYKKSFKNFNKEKKYFHWLYNENPVGKFIGIDCYENSNLIGQVGGIPYEFIFFEKKIKFLISINVCVDPDHQGKKLFTKMAVRLEEYAKKLNFDGIIAIANKAATPAWQRSINLNFLRQLDVFVGFGKMKNNEVVEKNYNFYNEWDNDKLRWRLNNPTNKTFLLDSERKIKSAYSKTTYPFINAYAPMIFYKNDINLNSLKKKNYRPIIFTGIVKDFKKNFLLFNLPNFLKPSPLNFLYKFLNSNNNLDPNEVFFTFLDFDAF